MAPPKKFRIPTLSEMDGTDTDSIRETVFKKHEEIPHDSEMSKPVKRKADADIQNAFAPPKTLKNQDMTKREKDSSTIQKDSATNLNTEALPDVEDENLKGTGTVLNKIGSSNCLIVNPRQRGNPILKSVRSIPWEYGNIVPDYVMGQSHCALFLSLRYHQLHPNYIHDRLKQLGRSYDLRVVLVQVDIKEPHQILKELAKICILADCTLILAFSPEEAGRYLETYKVFENKPPEAIMEKTEDNFMAKFVDCLTRVKSVNKTDCSTLLTAFGSLANVIEANEEDLSLCPGFGPQKAKRLHSLFHERFLRNSPAGKRKNVGTALTQANSSASS